MQLLISHLDPSLCRCFRAADGALKPMPMAIAKHSSQNFTCHAWVVEGERRKTLYALIHKR